MNKKQRVEIENKLLDLIIKSFDENSNSDWIYRKDEIIRFLKHFYDS